MTTQAPADYEYRRVLERIGMDLDACMRERRLTIAEVAKGARLTREAVAQIIDGTARDVDMFALVDVFYACGYRLMPQLARSKLVTP